MTLIIFIPHQNGWILVSDRQDTHEDSYVKEEVQKLFLPNSKGPAIGCSGPTRLIQTLFTRIPGEEISNDNIFQKMKGLLMRTSEDLSKMHSTGIARFLEEIEMIIIRVESNGIAPFYLSGIAECRIPNNHLEAIGEGKRDIKNYLNVDTSPFSEDQAIRFGEQLIREAAFSNFAVGAPEYHGYDVIKVSVTGDFSFECRKPTLGRLAQSYDIRGVLESVRIEEE